MGLAAVLDPATNLCLWCRDPLPGVVKEVASLQVDAFPNVRLATSPESAAADIDALFCRRGLASGCFAQWIDDMIQLVQIFSRLLNERCLTLRLETTDEDTCPRFHVDRTGLRLLCTYRGAGTEWLENDQVNRYAQQHGDANAAIVRYGRPAQFQPFWVGVMKGELFPGNRGNGLVHRSPPIAGTDQTRVLLCLDG